MQGLSWYLYFIAAGSDKVDVKYQIKDGQTWAEDVEIKKTKAQEQGIIRLLSGFFTALQKQIGCFNHWVVTLVAAKVRRQLLWEVYFGNRD